MLHTRTHTHTHRAVNFKFHPLPPPTHNLQLYILQYLVYNTLKYHTYKNIRQAFFLVQYMKDGGSTKLNIFYMNVILTTEDCEVELSHTGNCHSWTNVMLLYCINDMLAKQSPGTKIICSHDSPH